MDMDGPPGPVQEPANLRFLRLLVTLLTGVMILGLLTIVGLLVMRFRADTAPPALPATLALPEGVHPQAVTAGRGWYAVVSDDGRILIFGQDGTLRQSVEVDLP